MADDPLFAGLAGYAVALELLAKLYDQGVIGRDDGVEILDAALSALERVSVRTPHPAFDGARKLLDGHIRMWQQDRPSE